MLQLNENKTISKRFFFFLDFYTNAKKVLYKFINKK